MRDLVRFAKTWKLEKAAPEEIYAKYVDHNVEDSMGWVDPGAGVGEVAFDSWYTCNPHCVINLPLEPRTFEECFLSDCL